ncbi:MAG: ribosome maturation factor RimM [Tannerella sp.]|jgi:16S rRNA processing protein RimM|nr:ribosome maturation factor RimM [Tannerella sp.]
MIKEEGLIKIGHFAKPHGIKGEISLVTGYGLDGITCADPFIVCDMDGIAVPFFIESHRQKSNTVTLVRFDGIDSEDKAKLFTGKAACIPTEMLPSHDGDDGQDGRNDVTGYAVSDEKSGAIGAVTGIDDRTANALLAVDCKGKEILIPAALITAVDREHKTIEVSLPDGFWEL